jgi:hypothetical protein
MAGTLTISTLSDGTNSTSSTNCIRGSARAWVFYNGNTQTVQNSYGVSSVTYQGTGLYLVNWTTAFPTVYYALVTGVNKGDSNNDMNAVCQTGTTGGRQQTTTYATLSTGYTSNFQNTQQVCVAAFY